MLHLQRQRRLHVFAKGSYNPNRISHELIRTMYSNDRAKNLAFSVTGLFADQNDKKRGREKLAAQAECAPVPHAMVFALS